MTTTHRRTSAPLPPGPGLPWTWGDPGRTPLPPDRPGREVLLSRAVPVRAEPPVVFGWLGQLRVAPHSYDLIDNRGRRSPQTMTRIDPVEPGQTFAKIFTLTSFEQDRSITLELTDRVALLAFGPLTMLYRTLPDGARTVLRCDLMLPRPRNGPERLRQVALAWGDLVMMRRQLLNLRRLSERTASLA